MIVDHGKSPRNFGVLEKATHCRQGHNPLCGDKVTLYVEAAAGQISALRFEGKGCAISMASASLMTEALEGKTLAEAEQVFADFHLLVTEKEHPPGLEDNLGKLAAFKNLSEFPVRVKCATLAWHTLRAALAQDDKTVSTE
jgi:nitrogen fixation NifU-like protein